VLYLNGLRSRVIAATGVVSMMLLVGCLVYYPPDDDYTAGDIGYLVALGWLKGHVETPGVPWRFDPSTALTEGPTVQLPEIQSLGTATSSVRTGSSAGNASPLLVGALPRASSPFSTNIYVLDVVKLFQLDSATGNVLRSLDLTAGQPGSPSRLAITSDSKFAIVTNSNRPNQPYVIIVDLTSFTIAANIPIPENANAYGVAITPDNQFAYVVTQSLSTVQNSVYVVDLTARQVATSIPLPKYSSLQNIVMTPDGTGAYLNSGAGTDFQIPLIDTTTNTVAMDISTVYFSTATGSVLLSAPAYLAMHPDGTRVYLAPIDGGPIFVLDTATNTITHLIKVPQGTAPPAGTAPMFTPTGRFLFVLDGPGAFSVIDTSSDTVFTTIPLAAAIANGPPGGTKVGFYFVPAP
jgi:DNA-binding beta-propeller fold protein YncE